MNCNPFCSTDIQFMTKVEMEAKLSEITNMNLVLILSDSSVIRWNLYELIKTIKSKNNLVWIDKVNANPTQEDILSACGKIGMEKVDLIIAVGGGSAIDLAKGISTFYEYGHYGSTIDIITRKLKDKSFKSKDEFIDILAVPTTAGTGSELTEWATIWDINQNEKFSIDHIKLKPKKAFIVPELTLTLSRKLTLSTGLDALSHAMEAYWSKHTNPLVQDLAYRSIQLIVDNLIKVLDDPHSIYGRESMCRASVLAALAFSQTRTTACHSISYPMTMLYGVPHGFAVAMTLNEVAYKNKAMFPNDQMLFDVFQRFGNIQSWLDKASEGIVNLRLSGFGISKQDVNKIVDNAFTGGRMDNNPTQLSYEDVREILLNIF